MNSLNVIHQRQHEPSWCLPACVAMLSAYWGIPVLQVDVARWLGTMDIGTPSSHIQRLRNQGYQVTYGEGSLSSILDWLRQETPVIIFVRTGDLPYWSIDTAHAVTVTGLYRDQAFIIDLATDVYYRIAQ